MTRVGDKWWTEAVFTDPPAEREGERKRLEGRFPVKEEKSFPAKEGKEGKSVLRDKCQMSHVKSKQMEMCNVPYSSYYILIILYYYIYIIYI